MIVENMASPHVIAMPLPASAGHLNPMVHLCKLLAASGFSISILTPPAFHAHVSKLLGNLQHPGHGSIRIITFPSDATFESRSWDDIRYHLQVILDLQQVVEPIVQKIVKEEPPVVGLLTDVYLGWMQEVADKLNLPRVALWCSIASDFQIYRHSSRLIDAGVLPFKAPARRASYDDIDNAMPGFPGKCPRYHRVSPSDDIPDPKIIVPGLPPLARSEFPLFLQIEDSSDSVFHFFVNQVKRVHEAHMVVVNSVFDLEPPVFTAMQKEGNARPLGPLFFMREQCEVAENLEEKFDQKKDECIEWLDRQPPGSVIFVAFGTCLHLGPPQLAALARGLEASEQRFLWAILPDSTAEKVADRLPKGFTERIKGQGLVVDWAPQTQILRHASVGGFVTHCGWNSVMESLTFGKAVIGFPMVADHMIICKMMVDEMKVGMRLKSIEEGVPCATDLERTIREMMSGETGKKLRKRAAELGVAAQKAITSGGSSHATLQCLVEDLMKRGNSS